MAEKFKIKKDDEVIVISGKHKGQKGKVLEVIRKEQRVLVQGVNTVKRHTRPSPMQPGGIVQKELPIHISNVAIADPKTGKATRVGYKIAKDNRKVRFAKRSGDVIDS